MRDEPRRLRATPTPPMAAPRYGARPACRGMSPSPPRCRYPSRPRRRGPRCDRAPAARGRLSARRRPAARRRGAAHLFTPAGRTDVDAFRCETPPPASGPTRALSHRPRCPCRGARPRRLDRLLPAGD